MQKLIVLALQLQAIWGGLVIPCMQPEAFHACTSNHDEWVLPYVRDLLD